MRRKTMTVMLLILFTLVMFLASCSSSKLKVGEQYSGFTLVKKEFIQEVNSDCYYFEHEKSGARLLKIANDDPNKTFCATFKTLPQSDCGTPHILEHSVLNGSKNFPVKSPFDILAKGSLNTFLNAMTGGDITLYPVASMNDKDFRNLMNIYLDAVFFPLIYDDPRIFQQEGWHHELTSKDEPLVYKGVVFNEMKGAFSDPNTILGMHIDRALFPETSYRWSSGGYPEAIPTLTYENFLNFHRTYYHPTNSYLYLYGNSDILCDLEFIDTEYLSKFEKLDKRATIKIQEPFEKMKRVVENYPVSEDDEVADKTYLAMDWVIGTGDDLVLTYYLDILSDALVNHESGPIKLALQEAGIGQDVSAFSSSSKQNTFQINVRNANLSDMDKFNDIVKKVLTEVAEKGVDKDIVEGIVNRMEFRLREGDNSQKGLTYLFQSLASWFYADKPFESLKWEKPLAAMKKGIEEGELEELIRLGFLNNNHALLIALVPKPGMQSEVNEKETAELAEYKNSLSEPEKEALIKQTTELIEYQQKEDTPEALAKIPLLKLEDIGKKAEYFGIREHDVHGTKVLQHETFTNHILYSKLMFDVQVIPTDQLPYVALLAEVLGALNTENYSFGELDNELNKHLGSFSTYLTTYLANSDDNQLQAKFVVNSKAMNTKAGKLFELAEEVLMKSKIDDKERLKALLSRHQSRLNGFVMGRGINVAMTRLNSYFSNSGAFDEMTRGYAYYEFISDLNNNFDAQYDEIVNNLQEVAAILFNKNSLVANVTCNKTDLALYNAELHNFIHKIAETPQELQPWNFELTMKNEGLKTPSKVQYVTMGYNFKTLGHEYTGKMRVLNQILSRGWLTQQLRVIGGAYGGFSGFSRNGNVYFASYRDPNLGGTVENMNKTTTFMKEFAPADDEMTRYIIGTISDMDQPRSPSEAGNDALTWYMTGMTQEKLQAERDAVLATTKEDIVTMTSLVQDILDHSGICVYGNEEKIEAEKDLFKTVFTVK
ncbi:MAG: insulinase family protein [Candidatus Marinimicrobia bacterium]|nr:insulinase family protein [Candidatus Neomarinimicrobiota bacterium]